mmetsp:Transcript_3073/g.8916  ORF Transcript_3073/g.8916 Transcript_3073/m.8916 type:complete len:213 (+) Transcript_3073:174-812(+)
MRLPTFHSPTMAAGSAPPVAPNPPEIQTARPEGLEKRPEVSLSVRSSWHQSAHSENFEGLCRGQLVTQATPGVAMPVRTVRRGHPVEHSLHQLLKTATTTPALAHCQRPPNSAAESEVVAVPSQAQENAAQENAAQTSERPQAFLPLQSALHHTSRWFRWWRALALSWTRATAAYIHASPSCPPRPLGRRRPTPLQAACFQRACPSVRLETL